MIEAFPDYHELIWLFETQPEVLEPDEPWVYNTITFKIHRGGVDVIRSILPSYGDLSLRLLCQDNEILSVDIFRIWRLSVLQEKSREALVAVLEENLGLKPFVLQFKPHLRVCWGNELL